jgi:NADH dehydrogenase
MQQGAAAIGRGSLLITGADGYIGQSVVARALKLGLNLVVLSRSGRVILPPDMVCERVVILPWQLGQALADHESLHTVRACIHLAHIWHKDTIGRAHADDNLAGLIQLRQDLRRFGINRLVFASSISAREQAGNRYGRDKFRLEQELTGDDECAVRIGLVYGGVGKSQWAQLLNVVRLPFVPKFLPDAMVQPIYLDDVADALIQTALMPLDQQKIFVAGAAKPMAFSRFLEEMSRSIFLKAPVFIPIPVMPIICALRLLIRFVPAGAGLLERFQGMASIQLMDSAQDMSRWNIADDTIASRLLQDTRRAERRRLIKRGRGLLVYLLGRSPPLSELKRFVRLTESHGLAHGHDIGPDWLLSVSIGLRLCDPAGIPWRRTSRIRLFYRLAAQLASNSGAGDRFYDYRGIGRFGAGLALVRIGLAEICLLPLRLAFSVFTR